MSKLTLRGTLKAIAVVLLRLISSPSTWNGTAIFFIAMNLSVPNSSSFSPEHLSRPAIQDYGTYADARVTTRWFLFLISILLGLLGGISEVQAANSSGECYVTVNVSGGTLPAGWSYQLQYYDTDSNWYNGASGTGTQTYYKQQGDWANRSIQWRCQLKNNNNNYGVAQTNTCFSGSDAVSFTVAAPALITPPHHH